MPEIIVYSAFQAIVLLDMLPKKRDDDSEDKMFMVFPVLSPCRRLIASISDSTIPVFFANLSRKKIKPAFL